MNRLKEIRESRGLNQRQLAERVHSPQSLICAIERGRLRPWPKIINKLAKVLNVSKKELCSNSCE